MKASNHAVASGATPWHMRARFLNPPSNGLAKPANDLGLAISTRHLGRDFLMIPGSTRGLHPHVLKVLA